MATFGRFETVREIHRMGYVALYRGRTAQGSAETYAIKIFLPPALLLEEEQVKADIDLFLQSAAVQQAVAAGGARHWATVYEQGATAEDAFYVTDRYEHSLRQLIDVRLKLSSEGLGVIVEAVVQGLLELKSARGRPHGNLKATNVLIGGTGDISERRVVLCDPLPDDYVDPEVHWEADLRAVGEFVYQLVTHRPSPNVDGWQAPDSKEWRRLGRQGALWRDLCNRLFAAATKPGTMTIEVLAEDLARLGKMRPAPSYRWPVAAAVLVMVMAVVLFFVLKKPPPPEKVQWETLCREYKDWVGALYEQGLGLNRKGGNSRAQRWRQDDRLKAVVAAIEAAGYPFEVADDEGMTVEYIVDKPYLATAADTNDGLVAIERIRSFFDPNSSKRWPLLEELSEAVDQFRKRGWERPAAYLASVADSVRPEPNEPIAESVDKILALSKDEGTLKKIGRLLTQIDAYQEAAGSSGDPVLAQYRDYADGQGVSEPGPGSEADLNELHNGLQRSADLGRKLAAFVNGDWQSRVDQQVFFDDHAEPPPSVLTEETFDTRLDQIKRYYYLRPDPRDDFFALVDRIKDGIPLALVSNPVEADKCARDFERLEPSVEAIRKIRGIEKNRLAITKALADDMPRLAALEGRVSAATETATAYRKRIQEMRTIAKSAAINNKWVTLRDDLFKKYPEERLKEDLVQYATLRREMDVTEQSLVRLDAELQRELPAQIDPPPRATGWNVKVTDSYDRNRQETIARLAAAIPLRDAVPDVDDPSFRDFFQTELARARQQRADLGTMVTAFNAIEDGLTAYYLPDDKLPHAVQDVDTIGALWEKHRNSTILQTPPFDSVFRDPIARIIELERIDASEDGQALSGAALASSSQPEVVYAAWVRLGALSKPAWPDNYEDLGTDRNIRQKLRTKFAAASRREELLKKLTETAIKREGALIEKNRSADKILGRFDTFATEAGAGADLSTLESLEELSRALADYLCGADWQNGVIRTDIFFETSTVHNAAGPVTAETFGRWLSEVKDYRTLEQDPRTRYSWQTKSAAITALIEDELGRTGAGPLKQTIQKLEQESARFAQTVQKVDAMLALPAIEKSKASIDADTCNELWEVLLDHEATVRSIIKPEYCKHLELLEGEVQRLVFVTTTELSRDFEPVNISRLQSDTQMKAPLEAVMRSVQGSAESVASLSRLTGVVNRLPPSTLSGLLNQTVELADWDQIRQAVNAKESAWLGFFHTIDLRDVKNVGWPEYIVSKKDPSVILRFIPAGAGNPEPFYLAICETSNGQYRLFLEKVGAKRSGPNLPGWSLFTGPGNNRLIHCSATDVPSCAIKWDGPGNTFTVADADADAPVTWVTFAGARAYAQWLGGQGFGELPTASQHQYACRAGAGDVRPWGNALSQIASYAHVRGAAWQKQAEAWNRDKDRTVPPVPVAPLGAVEDYQADRTLDTLASLNGDSVYSSVWPVAGAAKPNAWGLYDMIGNVWEWCRNDTDGGSSQICGGSCLAPPQHVLLDSLADYRIDFDDKDNDVGFRVMAPAR